MSGGLVGLCDNCSDIKAEIYAAKFVTKLHREKLQEAKKNNEQAWKQVNELVAAVQQRDDVIEKLTLRSLMLEAYIRKLKSGEIKIDN